MSEATKKSGLYVAKGWAQRAQALGSVAVAYARCFATMIGMTKRQKVLILYLSDASLESNVVAWAEYDGTGQKTHMSGDSDEPPYPTGLDALLAGWRLFQFAPIRPEGPGQEFTTSYLRYEFGFEQWVDVDDSD